MHSEDYALAGSFIPRLTVVGVGGAGGNALNNMIECKLGGVQFLALNTDAQALQNSKSEEKIQLGSGSTGGLGAGARPEIGRTAAEESLDEVMAVLQDRHMVFITAGMGGGTGTGAAPVIARACKERGILTVGVVTKPFQFEGRQRMRLAEAGIDELAQYVDTLIVIPNQNLFRIANENTTFSEAFRMADNVLQSGVRGVTDLMITNSLINLDFADIQSAMSEMGKAMMGTGEASGEKRAIEAAEQAINNPLLDDISIKGARSIIINAAGGYDMTLFEVEEAANRVTEEADPDATIIFGATHDDSLEGAMRVTVVATGIEEETAMARAGGRSPATSGSTQGSSVYQPQQKQTMTAPLVEGHFASEYPAPIPAPAQEQEPQKFEPQRAETAKQVAQNVSDNISQFNKIDSISQVQPHPQSEVSAPAALQPMTAAEQPQKTIADHSTSHSYQPQQTPPAPLQAQPYAPTGAAAHQTSPVSSETPRQVSVASAAPQQQTQQVAYHDQEPAPQAMPADHRPAAVTPQAAPQPSYKEIETGYSNATEYMSQGVGAAAASAIQTAAPMSYQDSTEKKKAPSLFERITGRSREQKTDDNHLDSTTSSSSTYKTMPQMSDIPTVTEKKTVTIESTPYTAPQTVGEQGMLNIDAPAAHSGSGDQGDSGEEDFDIPAFLRRQVS